MTSPQQPQPDPAANGTEAQPQPSPAPGTPPQAPAAPPMPPAAPAVPQAPPAQAAPPAQPAQQPAPEQPAPAEAAGTMMLQAQPAPAPAGEAGTMMLQAQTPGQPPQPAPADRPAPGTPPQPPAPAREAGTMMLQAQPMPEPQPLAAHGPGKDAGTMMLQAQPPVPAPAPAPQPSAQAPAAPYAGPAPGAGYVSPIPAAPTHLGHALASEWTKIRSVRSTIWTLGVMAVLVLGIGALVATAVSTNESIGGTSPLFFGFFGMLLGVLCVLPLGVLVISSEYGTGMIRTTLTACPARGRVLAAKALVFFGLTFVVTTVVTGLVAIMDNALLGDLSTVQLTGAEWLKSTVGVSLYVSFLGLLALAVGSLIRHSAGAITIMIGLVLLPFVLSMFMLTDSLSDLRNFLLGYSIPNQMTVMYGSKFPFVDGGPSGWEPLWIVMGLAALALGGAYAAMRQRDV
ncbi:ABC transporter permease [Streptomyces lydicus]|uniref:ABC transporter permease n=1 Tax=Streptomyces lydicus TaxID=47763 RepID=UPI0037999AF2